VWRPDDVVLLFECNRAEPGEHPGIVVVKQPKTKHRVEIGGNGDSPVDDKYAFETGGQGKGRRQISGVPASYLVADDREVG